MTLSRNNLALTLTLSFFTPVIAVVGCGGDNSAPPGAGGSNGTGGGAGAATGGVAGSGTTGGATAGGSAGAGGSTGGSAGSGGSGGQSTPFECKASILAADAPNITNFSITATSTNTAGETQTHWGQMLGGDGGMEIDHNTLWGGIFRYGDDTNMNGDNVQFNIDGEALNAAGEVDTYSGVGIWFGPCVDATAFTGISFTVSGTNLGDPSQIQVMFQTNADSPIDPTNSRGACAWTSLTTRYSECVQPFVARPVTETPTTVEVRWADVSGGKPSLGTTGADLVGIQFQLPWMSGGTAYSATLTIDDVTFISN